MTSASIPNMRDYPKSTDYTTNLDPDGIAVEYSKHDAVRRLSGTVAKGDVLMWVAASASVPASAAKMSLIGTLANSALKFAGIAEEPGVSGDDIKVTVQGPTLVNCDADASAFAAGDVATAPTTTTGTAGRVAVGTWAATNIAGTAIGVFLGPGTASSPKALIDIGRF